MNDTVKPERVSQWRWGKAGQRLTEREQEQHRKRALRGRAEGERWKQIHRDEGYRLWSAGKLSPAKITVVLDAMGLYGPDVDEALGAHEPDVDHWEAGILYPTWEQTLALSELTGRAVRYFCGDSIPYAASSMRFHMPVGEAERLDAALVCSFTQEALAARLAGLSLPRRTP
jgi:hypothetical protein